jgi:acyl carrier protein
VEQTEIEKSVIELLKIRTLPNKHNQISLDALISDLEFDSLDKVEIIMELEDKLNRNIPEKVSETFITGRRIVEYITNQKEYCAKYQIDRE